jgi:hypothetical protein
MPGHGHVDSQQVILKSSLPVWAMGILSLDLVYTRPRLLTLQLHIPGSLNKIDHAHLYDLGITFSAFSETTTLILETTQPSSNSFLDHVHLCSMQDLGITFSAFFKTTTLILETT